MSDKDQSKEEPKPERLLPQPLATDQELRRKDLKEGRKPERVEYEPKKEQ